MAKTLITKTSYLTFISFMFSAAMVAWGATLLGIVSFLGNPNFASGGTPGFPQGTYLVGGILYGCVLICFFWLYAERIAATFLPTNLLLLTLDFVALTFMIGAGTAWRNYTDFNRLALWTLILLVFRFGFASCSEIWGSKKDIFKTFKSKLMTQIVIVYITCFILLSALIIGAIVFGELPLKEVWIGIDGKAKEFHQTLYTMICFGMLCGIAIVVYHSFKHNSQTENISTSYKIRNYHPVELNSCPVLIPDYSSIGDSIGFVSNNVFEGERLFRKLLKDTHNHQPFHYHLSSVHTYRDVETQAFIMASAGKNPEEIKLRAMWVYLAHWFDDLFDSRYPQKMSNMITKSIGVREVLKNLGDGNRLVDVWDEATGLSENHLINKGMLEFGMKRMMWSSCIFSPTCRSLHSEFNESHREFVIKTLKENKIDSDIIQMIERINRKYLAYTTKVVVEMWDGFSAQTNLGLSMLMNLFYAPGLFFHDSKAEEIQGELLDSAEITEQTIIEDTLKGAMEKIKELSSLELAYVAQPAKIYVDTFAQIFEDRAILHIYKDFIDDNIFDGL